MIKHNQVGAISGLAISLVLAILLLAGALGFAGWAFNSRQDYKNHSDAKVTAAVQIAVQKESVSKDAAFAEAVKNPLTTYVGSEAYGSLRLNYPKTWSGYVDDSGKGSALVDGYFSPGVVPPLTGTASVFALRIQVLNQTYAQMLQNFASQQQASKLTTSAYALPKLPTVTGVKVVGQLQQAGQTDVTMIVLPLRSQTLEIWTDGNQYLNDFNNIILPNFSFSP